MIIEAPLCSLTQLLYMIIIILTFIFRWNSFRGVGVIDNELAKAATTVHK